MFRDPTINDFLDLVRPKLSAIAERLQWERKAIENRQFSKGQTGAGIRQILDETKKAFEQGVTEAFSDLRRVADSTKLDRQDLRQTTLQELANFLLSIRAVADGERLKTHARNAPGVVRVVDAELDKLNQQLVLMTKQMDSGLLPLSPSGPPNTPEGLFTAPFGQGSFAEAFQSDAFDTDSASPRIMDQELATPWPTQSAIVRATWKNRSEIRIATTAFIALIHDRLQDLRNERPNSDESREDIDQAIAKYEDLQRQGEALLQASSELDSTHQPDQLRLESVAISFAQGIKNWWDEKHKQICEKAFDFGIFGLASVSIRLPVPMRRYQSLFLAP
jgi:hypothetical protein